MKNRLLVFLLVVFVFMAFAQVNAQSNVYSASPASDEVHRGYSINPALVAAGKNAVFDRLVKKELVSLDTDSFLCPTDIVSTNTAEVAYMTGVTPPCKIVITPLDVSTASITFDLYEKTAAGVTAPDTDCLLPLTNGRFEAVYFSMPNTIFGANTTGSATLEVYVPNY